MRVCGFDGFALELDLETARRATDAGWPPIELWTCRMGHSVREHAPSLHGRPILTRPILRCAVCGTILPPSKRTVCSADCRQFVNTQRHAAAREGETFILEAAPWYKGAITAYQKPALPLPLDPLAGRMPQAWAEGWLRLYGGRA